ncbi:MAG: LPS export ABC transporter permease LptF [Oxalobacteraceae bacterium]|jgi:lipopolysaccharide export system permease protein|nr:LPS export ABC transporter permease LptF [Oxalobacteraceae bacterium]
MIFQRAIRRELLNTVGAVFTTLFTIVITVMLIRILGDAAGGRVATGDVVALLGFAALIYLPVILSLTAFISVLLVVARSYQDSEMIVWFASGLSLMRWIRPIMSIGMPIVLLTASLSLWLTPWASRLSAEYKETFRNREDISRISPGKFQESASGDRIFFVEGLSSDTSKVENVFVSQSQGKNSSVVVAQEGSVILDQRGDKLLELRNGHRYDGTPGSPDFQTMDFGRYVIVVSSSQRELTDNKSARVLSTRSLIESPNPSNMAELLWRVSLPVMCLLQMLLAIPLGFVNPRRGRTLNLMIALVLAVSYLNSVGIVQAAVGQGRLSFTSAWWPLHLSALLVISVLFFWRNNTNSRWHPMALLILGRQLFALKRTTT